MTGSSALTAGEWVQIRSKEEILATLDSRGQLEGLPFMPEMLEFCGKRFQVSKRAHKTCDPPNGLLGRRMTRAVHLDNLRCSGESHGGCQAGCLLFWKDSWLQKLDGSGVAPRSSADGRPTTASCSEADLAAATRNSELSTRDEPAYVCQSTEVANASHPLPWWDVRQYLDDYRSGNVRLSEMAGSFLASTYYEIATAGLGIGAAMRWVYDLLQRLRGGTPYPWRRGTVPPGVRTPTATLNVQPGELVKIKSYKEILATLDEGGHNRGMWFDAELVPYCGGTYRVEKRVSRILNEKTGKMQHLKNDCIVLEDVVCRACYARNRKFCPRAILAYWREVWLERV